MVAAGGCSHSVQRRDNQAVEPVKPTDWMWWAQRLAVARGKVVGKSRGKNGGRNGRARKSLKPEVGIHE